MYKTLIIFFQLLFFVYFVIVVTKLFFIVTLILFVFTKCCKKINFMVPPLNWTYYFSCCANKLSTACVLVREKVQVQEAFAIPPAQRVWQGAHFLCQFCPYKAKRKWNLGVHLQKLAYTLNQENELTRDLL